MSSGSTTTPSAQVCHWHCKYRLQLGIMFNFFSYIWLRCFECGLSNRLTCCRCEAFSTWGAQAGGSLNDLYCLRACVCVYVGVCVTSWDCIPAWENQWDQCNMDQSISICTHATHTHPSHRHIALSATYMRAICTHFVTHCSASLHSLCTQSRILMCSLRALLSVCVTFHPSTHHFQPHHRIEWKQFGTNSIQSLHRLRWHSMNSTFHHLCIIMRHYAAPVCVSLYHFISLIYPTFNVDWNITLKLQCTSLREGNPLTENFHLWALLLSSAPEEFICVCVCLYVHVR